MNRVGRGLYFKGMPYQRGSGIGSRFKNFFSWLVPILKKHAVPALKAGITEVGKKALLTASNIVKDVSEGRDFKTASSDNINRSVEELKNEIEKKLEGRGRKKLKRSILLKHKKSKKFKNFEEFFNQK